MRTNLAVKFILFVLTALLLLSVAVSGLCIAALEFNELYTKTPGELMQIKPHLTDTGILLFWLYPYRYTLIAVLLGSLLLASIGIVMLISTAGRQQDGSVQMRGLTRLPLDFYIVNSAVLVFPIAALAVELLQRSDSPTPPLLCALGLFGFAVCLLALGVLYVFCAQLKMPGRYWWHHSIIGWIVDWALRIAKLCCKAIGTVLSMIPLTWKLLVTLALLQIFICIGAIDSHPNLFFLGLFSGLAVVLYLCYCMGLMLTGVRKMSQGDLNHKINTRFLFGSFLEFATQLNNLSDTAKRAAQESLRSERMKTELITNVSHDIKTPLTSIINFVDLLQKPHTPQEEEQYLEVLSRQSAQMKRLIEDLIDLSKANTGNIQVSLEKVDLVEMVNQALGEFSDKLVCANLVPVFRQTGGDMCVQADGRLTWRIISNLLTNVQKYAMPGTRVYLDLVNTGDSICLLLKNISKEELHVNAEDLLERFVQGDTSRSTEGSGLGLNIAKSLMEVQGGQLHLMLDGDLFKVTLVFPQK